MALPVFGALRTIKSLQLVLVRFLFGVGVNFNPLVSREISGFLFEKLMLVLFPSIVAGVWVHSLWF